MPEMIGAAEEILANLWRINLPMPDSFTTSVNVYLVRDKTGFVLIDCGLEIDESRNQLSAALGEIGASLDAIHRVVVTHGHHDHCGLAGYLHREHGAQVWMHESDWDYICRRYSDTPAYRQLQAQWLTRYGMPSEEATKATERLGLGVQAFTVLEPDRVLSGGESVEIGNLLFEILWTPGHTPGHICLIDSTNELLLSGDHILPNVHANVSLQPYSTVNPLPGYIDSLRALAERPIQMTMPGHGDLIDQVPSRAKEIVQHQLNRRSHIQSVLTPSPQSAYDMAAIIWKDSKPNNWDQFSHMIRRNAVGTLIAHLELMVDDGIAGRIEEDVIKFSSHD
jgi:glyoxylase-like metal-dependent hydrolase (beta-lactamase superfamily II)